MKEKIILGNKSLRNARTAKNDEFYTQLSTIEQEIDEEDFDADKIEE